MFAKTKTVLVKEQIPKHTLIDLLCQIGGCLGLWLGISVVSFAEFIHLILHLATVTFEPTKFIQPLKTKIWKMPKTSEKPRHFLGP